MGLVTRRLNANATATAQRATPLQIARAEAAAIDAGRVFGQALRLHVSGDCRTDAATRVVAAAAARYRRRGGGPVWSYTHAWRRVSRGAWGDSVAILASCDRIDQGAAALARGFAPAVTVATHTTDRTTTSAGVNWIPCPAQTRGVSCVQCRLCWHANELRDRRQGIAFAAHGAKERELRARLPVLGG